MYYDSQSAIHLSKNQTHHEKTRHIDAKLHFVKLSLWKGCEIAEDTHRGESI